LGKLGLVSFGDQPEYQLQVRDPFADDTADASGGKAAGNVHIRVQQRNGRKCITTVQGLNNELDLKLILKEIKKTFCCNGSIVTDTELGTIIQLQGDQRDNISKFLVDEGLCDKEKLKIHGF
jgi:translation initiation factor 1